MTTWVTFETIDESPNFDGFYIDRLGMHQYRSDDRTRFELVRAEDGNWWVEDYEWDEVPDRSMRFKGTMREAIQWVGGRMVYGA